jgi:hypothetical protein
MDVLGGLFGGNKKSDSTGAKVDSSAAKKQEAVTDDAKDILGGLFGKKKKTAVKKDSVN